MVSRTWIGGGSNQASDPDDWSPTGAPVSGDLLGLAVNGATLTVSGDHLAGDTLAIVGNAATVNLDDASATITVQNVTGGLGAPIAADFNLSGANALSLTALQGSNPNFDPSGDGGSVDSVNLRAGAVWDGTFALNRSMSVHWGYEGSKLAINGASGSVFENNGTSVVGDSVVVDATVSGTGTFTFAPWVLAATATLEFAGSVAAGETVAMPGYQDMVVLDDPQAFFGTVGLTNGSDVIDLKTLGAADGYTYAGGVVSVYAGDTVIDRLAVTSSASLQVEKTDTDLFILQNSGSASLGTALPVYAPVVAPQFADDNSPGAEVYRLYQAAFDRLPDSSGDAFWIGAVQGGLTPLQMAADFVGSAEFQAGYGGLSVSDFVTRLYANILGRTPDPGGQAYWEGALATGVGQATVLADFADSPENRVNTVSHSS